MVQRQKMHKSLYLGFGLSTTFSIQNSSASKCNIVNITVIELTHKQKTKFLAMRLKPAKLTTTWEEWVATQAELALTSSMANLNHTVWKLGGFPTWIWFCVLMDWWVYNLEIGVDFVNKDDADLLILVGLCWVQISGYAYLFLGLIVGVCWFLGFECWWVYVDF